MKFLAVAFFYFLIFACGIVELFFPIYYPQRYIERKVNLTEISGTWQITSDSVARIEAYLKQPDEIFSASTSPWQSMILKEDGTCEVDLELSWDIENDVLKEDDAPSTCTWKLERVSTYDEDGDHKYVDGLFIRFEHYNEKEDMYYVDYSESYFVEENNKLVIWNFIGDPSFARYQDFHKVDHE